MENNLLPETVYQKLPEAIMKLIEPFSGRERDVVFLSTLGVLSAAFPKVYGIYDGKKISPNLYLLVIAPAASGKGIMNVSKKLIEKIHDNLLESSTNTLEECIAERKQKKDISIKCPDLEVKVIPGNVSSAKIYKHLKNASHGLLIFETEADTISVMLKQDWGNFSDILRKAFHHETISISRETENKYIEVKYPELSMVISGTPNQVSPLIQSTENGLFSRFMFYVFDDIVKWKDVSPKGLKIDYNALFTSAADEISILYEKLQKNNSNVEVTLSEKNWEFFNVKMNFVTELYIKANQTNVLSIIKRQGLILFRICLILTIIRNKDLEEFPSELVCHDDDFDTAFGIMKTTIDHSLQASNLLNNGNTELLVREALLLTSMTKIFTRAVAVNYATEKKIPTRSVDFILKKLLNAGFLYKISNGVYEKTI